MSKHTPGPLPESLTATAGWKGGTVHYENDFSHPLTFSVHWGEFCDQEIAERGAALLRLIAAAPDLLAALRDLVANVERETRHGSVTFPGINEARSALARVDGEG